MTAGERERGEAVPPAATRRGSRAARVLRRTAVGGVLALVLGLLLWATERSEHGPRIVLGAAAVMLAGSVLEIDRMGRLRGRRLGLVLLLPSAFVVWSGWAADVGRRFVADLEPALALYPEARLATWLGDPWLEVAFVVVLAAGAHGVVRLLQALALFRGSAAAALLVLGAVLAALVVGGFGAGPEDSESHVRLAFAVAALLAASSIAFAASREEGLRDLGVSVAVAVWIVPWLPALVHVVLRWGAGGLVALVVLAKVGDVAGYYVGNLCGKTHPFPRISPGKTTAGCVGSLVCGTVAGAALVHFGVLPPARLGFGGGLLVGALVNVAAQGGDLLESWVKRRAGVKDSSSLFGPSGGFLDLTDSLLLAVPVALLTWPWLLEPGT